jgi:hypothetical protein
MIWLVLVAAILLAIISASFRRALGMLVIFALVLLAYVMQHGQSPSPPVIEQAPAPVIDRTYVLSR